MYFRGLKKFIIKKFVTLVQRLLRLRSLFFIINKFIINKKALKINLSNIKKKKEKKRNFNYN
jgi:hypothetical protein